MIQQSYVRVCMQGAEISILERYLHLRSHCRIIHSQDVGTTRVPWWMDGQRGCGTYGAASQPCLQLCNPTDCGHQAPLSMGFSRLEHCSGWSFPSPGDLPDLGIEPRSPTLQVDSLLSESLGKPGYVCMYN